MNSSEGWQFQGIQVWEEGHTWPRASCPHLPIQYFTIICSNGDLNRTYSSGWHCATIASFIYFFYSYSIISLSRYPVTLKLPRQCQSIKEHNFVCSQYSGRFVVFYLCYVWFPTWFSRNLGRLPADCWDTRCMILSPTPSFFPPQLAIKY